MFNNIKFLFFCICLLATFQCAPSQARELTDSSGSAVKIPEKIERVWGTSPPVTALIYAIDPSLLIGVNLPYTQGDEAFILPVARNLPVLGGWVGHGQTPNLEEIFKLAPQLAILWDDGMLDMSHQKKKLALAGIATATIRLNRLDEYPAALRFLGNALNRRERAETLARYIEKALDSLKQLREQLPAPQRVSIYYAEGAAGLNTECDESFHVEALELAVGRNVYHCRPQSHFGMEQVSLEQVIAWAPDVLLVQEPVFFERVYGEPNWKALAAVQQGRVIMIPRRPFNWIDRPPSFMRALGAQWLANLLYPERYPLDLPAAIREFYRLFLRVELDENMLKQVMPPAHK
ncbi:ABC transporter substrate-binding protein [Candidatus Methylospira mobilis]|uniref:ABC transporter substrate-binding protein n=1 Tax=Candidatus Methylospira mobilis TaxID=1808979 RepID=A0A5Q0BCE8_9GAMM|nr:ABC transporter substrate-binding protein [Candidatus Methylospira mobilis]QFY41535.1 ABC transporter substrate-binding protein [Candidatus Methylospira mobilis]WNV05227.1 ABC transporter substrate-binding protein [Candidatus Methylospira mobilis]